MVHTSTLCFTSATSSEEKERSAVLMVLADARS
jgi:hypothetical protein